MRTAITTLLLLTFCTALQAQVAEFGEYRRASFNPTVNEQFQIPVTVEKPGRVTLRILSPDGDLVRTLGKAALIPQTREFSFTWNGRDEAGNVVPDEAYVPVLTWQGKGAESINDPSTYSGGEVIESIQPDFSRSGVIAFDLEKPARVLIRAGIQNGPLMRTLLNWKPRDIGKNIVPWDGYDCDGVVHLTPRPDLGILLTGFQLPRHSIIVHGGDRDYIAWRKASGWQDEMPDPDSIKLERDGKRLSRHFYLPRSVEIEPTVSLEIVGADPGNTVVSVHEPFTARVDLTDTSKWAMSQSLYEIAFFIDGEFIAEEEQGYVPLSWRWDPASLSPGRHTLTVNVSGFNGAVGVRTLELNVADK